MVYSRHLLASGQQGGGGEGPGWRKHASQRLLPGVLLLLGGHIEAEVKLPAPLGVAGQGRHQPLAGGARRLELPYCRHTSGQLLGEVTKRRSIHLSSGSTETRHVTPGGRLRQGLDSGAVPSLRCLSHPVPAPRVQERALGRGAGGLGSSGIIRQTLPLLSEPQSFLHLSTDLVPGPERGSRQ